MKRRQFTQTFLTLPPALLSVGQQIGITDPPPKRIPKTDTHVHLFDLEHLSYGWLKNAPEINRTFTLDDFRKASKRSNIGKILFMESGADAGLGVQEAQWVAGLAKEEPRIKGIIAKLDLGKGKETEATLEQLEATQLLKGLRGGFPEDAATSRVFLQGLKLLEDRNLSFDLLLNPSRMPTAVALAKKCAQNTFVLDHFGNPAIKTGDMEEWKKGIRSLAELPNVNCKMSGIITRVGKEWSLDQIRPYVHYAMDQFGTDRLVYGGDWPVVLRAGSYRSWSKAFEKLTSGLSEEALHKVYHLNADRIYRL